MRILKSKRNDIFFRDCSEDELSCFLISTPAGCVLFSDIFLPIIITEKFASRIKLVWAKMQVGS